MPRRRLTDEEKRARKMARELATSMRQAARQEYLEERHREEARMFRLLNPESVAKSQRKWRQNNLDYQRAYDRARYAADPEKYKARRRAHYEKNKERINAARRAKRQTLLPPRPNR